MDVPVHRREFSDGCHECFFSHVLGIGYGVVWWILGPLLIMPAVMGMGVFMVNVMTLQSLLGHLLFGLVLGLGYVLVRSRA